MGNEEIINLLENIKNMLENDEGDLAIDFINKKVNELNAGKDATSDYIDNLVNQLK